MKYLLCSSFFKITAVRLYVTLIFLSLDQMMKLNIFTTGIKLSSKRVDFKVAKTVNLKSSHYKKRNLNYVW